MLKSAAMLAVPTPEGATAIEVRAKVAEIIGRRPTRHPWLFALLKPLVAQVHKACECTLPSVTVEFSLQQGEVVHQRFQPVQLGPGDAQGITLGVAVAEPGPVFPPADQLSLHRHVWGRSLHLNLDRQPWPDVVL